MRIVSLVPHATELLFALGLGDQVVGVTHECDYPDEALDLPQVTRDVLEPGLAPGEVDAAVRADSRETAVGPAQIRPSIIPASAKSFSVIPPAECVDSVRRTCL